MIAKIKIKFGVFIFLFFSILFIQPSLSAVDLEFAMSTMNLPKNFFYSLKYDELLSIYNEDSLPEFENNLGELSEVVQVTTGNGSDGIRCAGAMIGPLPCSYSKALLQV